MMLTSLRHPAPHDNTAALSDAIPQFFIALVNDSDQLLQLTQFKTASACGWVREPILHEVIAPGDERIWCGMPWDLDAAIAVSLQIHGADNDTVHILFGRTYPAVATASVAFGSNASLYAEAELQREASSSPFLLVTVRSTAQ